MLLGFDVSLLSKVAARFIKTRDTISRKFTGENMRKKSSQKEKKDNTISEISVDDSLTYDKMLIHRRQS